MASVTSTPVTGLSNDIVLRAANALITAAPLAGAAPDSLSLGQTLIAAVAARSGPDARKGNPNGGPGRRADWYILEDEGSGVFPMRGLAAIAERLGRKEQNLRVAVSRAGGKWTTTRQTDSGEWGVCVRKATEVEAAELDAQEKDGTKNA